MQTCPKGHRFPDTMTECPVCAKENELKTVYSGKAQKPPSLPPQKKKPPAKPANAFGHDLDDDKTLIVDRKQTRRKFRLAGWLIELDDDDNPVNSYQLFNRENLVGRNRNNDIVIPDKSVSGTHCSVVFEEGVFVIYDQNSSNGTIINDEPVESQVLKENHIIWLGQSKLRIKYL